MFFVKEKEGGIRLLCDCRLSHLFFERPPSTRLYSSGGFAEVDASNVSEVRFGGFDVKFAFFQTRLTVLATDLLWVARAARTILEYQSPGRH